MNQVEKNSLIQQKKAEIERLKREIKDLRNGWLAERIKNRFIRDIGYRDGIVYIDRNTSGWSGEWDDVKSLACKLFFRKDEDELPWYGTDHYHSYTMKQTDMTDEQRQISAEFCDEVIDIYNKYVLIANTFTINGKQISYKGEIK